MHRDSSVADQYWQNSLHNAAAMLGRGVGREGAPDEPPKFKVYRGLRRHSLPQRTPSQLGAIADAFASPRVGAPATHTDRELTGELLGCLLYYGYGFSRIDVGAIGGWPYHRLVPSARCFYPTELYVWLPGAADLPAGVYHYDQLHHCLVELRAGVDTIQLESALGAELESTAAVLLLTSHYWKTAFRYRHYAYRLCSQESGMVAGNVLLVAQALGLRGHIHYQFLDRAVDTLLGVAQGEERTVAAVPLYWDGADTPERPRRNGRKANGTALERLTEIRPHYLDVAKDLSLASDTYEIDRCSVLHSTEEFATDLDAVPDGVAATSRTRWPASDADPARPVDLATALRKRHSGGTVFRPIPGSIPAGDLVRIARHALTPYAADIATGPYSTCYLVVQNVAGVTPGVYRCDARGELWPVPRAAPDALSTPVDLALGPPVTDYRAVNVMAYVVADRSWASSRLGNRGYRILNQDAGLVAQRICVLSGAAGLAARPGNGYVVPAVQAMLGIGDPDHVPLFQIAIGRRATTAQYEMSIVF